MGDDNWLRQSKFISEETIGATCEALGKLSNYQEQKFSVVLHGGEPLLLGISRLRNLLNKLRQTLHIDYPISIQTNGILITNEILNICSDFRVSIAVSVDGPKEVHDQARIGYNSKGTFKNVRAGIKLLQKHNDSSFLNAGLLAVVNPDSNPFEVYNFFKAMSTPSVDFLYKDGNYDKLPLGKSSLDSLEYGSWMAKLFKIYINDPNPVPIRILDDMLKVMLGGMVSKEGLGLTNFGIIIIDTDGTITKNDTLKSAFNGADRFQNAINIKENNFSSFIQSDEFLEYKNMQKPTNDKCLNCPYLNICGGGMILHRWSSENKFNNPSVYCSDQIYLIRQMQNELTSLITNNAS